MPVWLTPFAKVYSIKAIKTLAKVIFDTSPYQHINCSLSLPLAAWGSTLTYYLLLVPPTCILESNSYLLLVPPTCSLSPFGGSGTISHRSHRSHISHALPPLPLFPPSFSILSPFGGSGASFKLLNFCIQKVKI